VHSVIANIHSGWRGTAQGITSKTLDTLAGETRFDPAVSRAWLGPSIRVCVSKWGRKWLRSSTRDTSTDRVASSASRSHAKPHLDIPALTKDILRTRGFGDDAIIDTELCTRCEGSIFHSYRREGKGGRTEPRHFRRAVSRMPSHFKLRIPKRRTVFQTLSIVVVSLLIGLTALGFWVYRQSVGRFESPALSLPTRIFADYMPLRPDTPLAVR